MTTDAPVQRSVPLRFVDEFALQVGEDVYALRVDNGTIVLVENWKRVAALKQRMPSSMVAGDRLLFRLGEAAAEDFEHASEELLYAGLLVAAATGHPDEEVATPDVVWSPHLVVASGDDPSSARTKTDIRRPSRRLAEFHARGVRLVGRAAARGHGSGTSKSEAPPTTEVSRRRIPLSLTDGQREGYEYWLEDQRVRAQAVERDLVDRFVTFLGSAGHDVMREQLKTETGSVIEYDLYDASRSILFEAKADGSMRAQVRMAIGQLYDYSYEGFERNGRLVHKALLVPNAPPDDLRELLGYLDIGVTWAGADGTFEDDHPWR